MRNGLIINEYYGYKTWYKDDKIHRLDKPAVEWANGSKGWLQNGKYHRTDGPAVENADGYKDWYFQGELIMETQGDVTKEQLDMFLLKIL